MKTELQLKPVLGTDKQAFLRMAVRHFTELNPAFVPQEDWKRFYFETIMQKPDWFLRWVVWRSRRAGFVLYGVEPHRFLPRRSGMIYEIYLAAGYRRLGLGSACAKLMLEHMRSMGLTKVQLEVWEGNDAAAHFWSKFGFRRVSCRYVLQQ